ncbi:unnamed protein product, partial [Mesorhabditis spiculigera]
MAAVAQLRRVRGAARVTRAVMVHTQPGDCWGAGHPLRAPACAPRQRYLEKMVLSNPDHRSVECSAPATGD